MIRALTRYQIGQHVRTRRPAVAPEEAGTPTMGGALIIVAMVIGTLLWADLSAASSGSCWSSRVAFGGIGFYDDYLKLVVRQFQGPVGALQVSCCSRVAALSARHSPALAHRRCAGETALYVPFFKNVACRSAPSVRRARLLRHRRRQQRGESHRRPRRTGDHARGDGRRRARRVRLCHRATSTSRTTC